MPRRSKDNNYHVKIKPVIMFCPKCGKENVNGDKFCGGCGAVLTGSPQQAPAPSASHGPHWPLIFIGAAFIAANYIFPIIPISTFGITIKTATIAQAMEICNNPIVSCGGGIVPSLFYGFWAIGIILIVGGLISKR
jgi:hypothetical protein